MPRFTVESRERLRDVLVARARRNERIVGAAHTGSHALGRADRWSDIDLALSVDTQVAMDDVVADWTRLMYDEHDAVAHHDVRFGATLFRVFLLADTLQVDLAFWRDGDFGALGPAFQLIFGNPAAHPAVGPLDMGGPTGLAWLHALHVRSSLARGRLWQAEHMLGAMRGHVLALACARHGLPAQQGRGIDDLPREVTAPFVDALVRSLDAPEIARAFVVAIDLLLRELEHADAPLARRLAPTLTALAYGPAGEHN